MKKIKTLWPHFMDEFNCVKAKEPLRGSCLIFTTQSPGVPDTHLIDLGKMKG